VGASQGIFLHDGDTVEVEIDGVGAVSNPVRKDRRSRSAAPVDAA
jgi:2-keto-4-pentenoate hydratase/2-oxohepta-3-ene-1,7-dioic acid hydratase in catechol pathway